MRKNIDLRAVASFLPRGFEPFPYQVEPLIAQFRDGVRAVTMVAPEQTGKTLIGWVVPLIYRICNMPGPTWVVYPSDDKAAEKNEELVEPLMRAIPKLARELERKGSKRNNPAHYNLSTCKIYYSGAGSAVISKTIQFGICDEPDHWPKIASENEEAQVRQQDNIVNMEKRLRQVPGSCLVCVCSPTTKDGLIWRQYNRSSMAVWHLRCLYCEHLHSSNDLMPLKWEKDLAGYVMRESVEWECPECNARHTFDQAEDMNRMGQYVHTHEHRVGEHPGFQFGALCCPQAPGLHWGIIAQKCVDTWASDTLAKRAELANSFRGLPYFPKKVSDDRRQQILSHCRDLPSPDDLAIVLFSADTQDDGWFWVVRGFDLSENSYRLGFGQVKLKAELLDAWNDEYLGHKAAAGIIDEGGHHSKDIQRLCAEEQGLYTYKGDTQAVRGHDGKFYRFNHQDGRILARHKHYNAELLHHIHYQRLDPSSEGWFLPPAAEVGEDYIAHLAAVRKGRGLDGDNLENWTNFGKADHYFDAEKQIFTLYDFCKDKLARKYWLKGMPFHQAKREPRPQPEMN